VVSPVRRDRRRHVSSDGGDLTAQPPRAGVAHRGEHWRDHALEPMRGGFTQSRYFHSYHLGIYLAVNAIPDAFVAIDGPDCLNRKMEWVHVAHDMRSTLVDPCGEHRVVTTLLSADNVIKSQGDELQLRIRRIARIPGAGLILVNSQPHVTIIGTQYDKVIAAVGDLGMPVIEVPSRSLSGDWLGGYADTLEAIAARIDLPDPTKVARHVGVVGHLMDRNEADQVANVAEIERLVAGAGGECVSVWLSGRPTSHLREIASASTLIALPHGRKAAAALARRTGAQVVEVDLPVGLMGSRALVNAVARACGTTDRAEAFWRAELRSAAPLFRSAVQRFLSGMPVAFAGDPAWFVPLAATLEEVGARLVFAAAPARRPMWLADTFRTPGGRDVSPSWGGPCWRLGRGVEDAFDGAHHGVLIADSALGASAQVANWLPLGFPCYERHAIADVPFLGVRGWCWLMEQLLHLRLQPRR